MLAPPRLSLLLIEDNPADRVLVREQLTEITDHDLRFADSLATALRLIEESPPDLVLLDLQLPDAAGLTGLERLQRLFPELAIVVFSGFGSNDLEMAREAIAMGAQDYLYKDLVEPGQLNRTIQLALERKLLEQHRIRYSHEDELTGLPRPVVLEQRFDRAAARARRVGKSVALFAIGIDRFDGFVHEHGRDQGDGLIIAVGGILGATLRRTDCLARCDGGSFKALIENMSHAGNIYDVARKLLSAIARGTVTVDGIEHDVSISIGIAAMTPELDDFQALARESEKAMFSAMKRGGNAYQTGLELVSC